MSDVTDRGVIDLTLQEDGKYVLVISDHLEWNYAYRKTHVRILQDKINDYLGYIGSGQAEEAAPGMRPVIRIMAAHPYSRYCLDYLERVKAWAKDNGDLCDVEWGHLPGEEFDDGFSDDFVLDLSKVYPRLKKNWAKDPLKEVSLTAVSQDSPDYGDMPMFRYMDSYVYMFIQDMGNMFTYLSYGMLPEGITPQILQENAFRNLSENINYRSCESKEKGIYGILAGGDFEAESLLFPGIWNQIAEELNDDVIFCIPTKDIVFYTAEGNRKLRNKMLKMAADMFESNRRETPHLLFSRDVFVCSKKDRKLTVSRRYTI